MAGKKETSAVAAALCLLLGGEFVANPAVGGAAGYAGFPLWCLDNRTHKIVQLLGKLRRGQCGHLSVDIETGPQAVTSMLSSTCSQACV